MVMYNDKMTLTIIYVVNDVMNVDGGSMVS